MSDQLDIFLKAPPEDLPGIFIPGNVPSLKNNKEIVSITQKGARKCPACGNLKRRPMLIPSKRHEAYAKEVKPFYLNYRSDFLEMAFGIEGPLRVAFQFFRDSRRSWDYDNAITTCQDLMVKNGWLKDDSADHLIPVIVPYKYRKERPGVTIAVLK